MKDDVDLSAEAVSQLSLSVRNLRLLGDMILVRPDPAPDKLGSIFAPQGSLPQGHQPSANPATFMGVEQRTGSARDTFIGTVVACGPGDRFHEKIRHRPGTGGHEVVRTLINQDGSRRPMKTKLGDRVVYPRRPNSPVGTDEGTGESAIYLDGEKYLLFHESQFALAIVVE